MDNGSSNTLDEAGNITNIAHQSLSKRSVL